MSIIHVCDICGKKISRNEGMQIADRIVDLPKEEYCEVCSEYIKNAIEARKFGYKTYDENNPVNSDTRVVMFTSPEARCPR